MQLRNRIKINIIILVFTLSPLVTKAQTIPNPQLQLRYDDAGNRIQRKMIGINSWKTDSSEVYNMVNEGLINVFPNPVSTQLNIGIS